MKLKAQNIFQAILLVSGLVVGLYFSRLSNAAHDDHAQAAHGLMEPSHGMYDVEKDSIIPDIIRLEVLRDHRAGWNIHIITRDFLFTPEHINKHHVPGQGHAHLFVNGRKTARIYSNWFHLPDVDPTNTTIEVTLNSNTHETLVLNGKPIAARVNL